MQVNVLFISNLPPIKESVGGGEQTFRYYFKKFLEDDSFNVKLITCSLYKYKNYIDKELKDVDKRIVYWHDPTEKKIEKINNIESKYNPWNRNANLVSNTTEEKIIKYIKNYFDIGYVPDVIILEWTEMVVLSKRIKREFPNILLIASEHDVTFIGYKRKSYYYKGLRGLFWKFKYLHEKKIEVSALKKCELVLPHNTQHSSALIDNGIDPNNIMGLVPYYKDLSNNIRSLLNNEILFFGAMNRVENSISVEWFINSVMPRLNDIDCKLVVVGNNPENLLTNYESDKIHFTGFIDDISPYFQHARCFVAPLRLGAGIKIKVLEAFSSGIPVLTNDIGIEGIPADPSKDYFHCESADEYSDIIHSIFYGNIDAELVGAKGKEKILSAFTPEAFWVKYKNTVESLVEG